MTLEDAPALLIVGLMLRELRGMRLGLEMALGQLRADLRAVLGLLVPAQGGRGPLELPPGGAPAGVREGAGDEPEAVQEGAEGVQEIPGLEDDARAARVAKGGEAVRHWPAYRPVG